MATHPVWPSSVTERDLEIFQFLFESKVATGSQLREKFFPNITVRTTNHRLRRLTDGGWLKRSGHASDGRLYHIFSASEKAYESFVELKLVNDKRRQLKSDAVDHDLALVNIRWRIESAPLVKQVLTENVLQSYYEYQQSNELQPFVDLRSDGAVEFTAPDEQHLWVPLEYECSVKSIGRCREKLRNYYIRYGGVIVLFICKDEGTLKRMFNIERELAKEFSPKMHFALLDEFLSSTGKMTFSMVDGKRYTFG